MSNSLRPNNKEYVYTTVSIFGKCRESLLKMFLEYKVLLFNVSVSIHLMPKWTPFKYSFVYLQISP